MVWFWLIVFLGIWVWVSVRAARRQLLRPLASVGAGFIAASAALAIVGAGIQFFSDDDSTSVPSATVAKDLPLEHQLAIVNAGHYVAGGDITVKRFGYLLRSLHAASGYDRQKVVDMVTKTRAHIRERYGRDVTYLDIMEAANGQAANISMGKTNLDGVLIAYALLAARDSS